MMVGEPYTDGVRFPQVKELLDKSLRRLDDELALLYQKTEWAKECLFEYNERAFVGLFNNAIVRNSKDYCTFQEYQVYVSDNQFLGRADLLIVHNDFDLLFEAKKWIYDGKDDEDMVGMFADPKAQLIKYYEAERSYFKKKQTFLGVLIFEYVCKDYLGKLRKLYNKKSASEKGIGFDAFYVSEKDGLMVYGQIFQPNGQRQE